MELAIACVADELQMDRSAIVKRVEQLQALVPGLTADRLVSDSRGIEPKHTKRYSNSSSHCLVFPFEEEEEESRNNKHTPGPFRFSLDSVHREP